jgi:HNH endonuclease
MKKIELTEKDVARFWSKVDKNGPLPDQTKEFYQGLDRCWVWLAGKSPDGYGKFVWGGGQLAHRASYYLFFSEPHGRLLVLHRCDNPACVNPSHLFLGTGKDNADDRDYKKRRVAPSGASHRLYRRPDLCKQGEKSWLAVLKDSDIYEIRRLGSEGLSFTEIGASFGISRVHAGRIINRECWKHLH